MNTVLKVFSVKRIEAEVFNVVAAADTTAEVTQSSILGIGTDPEGNQLLQVKMRLTARAVVATVDLLNCKVDFEGVFATDEPIDLAHLQTNPKEGNEFANVHARQVYPHAVLFMQRMLLDMGLFGVRFPLEYPANAVPEANAATSGKSK